MTDLSLVLAEELLSLPNTVFLTLYALTSPHHTTRSTSGYGFPSTPTSCLSVLYRPPNSDDSSYILHAENMDQLLSTHPNTLFLICCDFNCHHASRLGVGTSLTCHGTSAKDFCDSLGPTECQLPHPDLSQWYFISSGFDFDQFPRKWLLFFCSNWFNLTICL